MATRDPISTEEAKRLGCRFVEKSPISWTFDAGRVEDFRPPLPGEKYGVLVLSPETAALDDIFLRRIGELSDRLLNEKLVDRLIASCSLAQGDRAITVRHVSMRTPVVLIADDMAPETLMGIYKGAEFPDRKAPTRAYSPSSSESPSSCSRRTG